jgi:hypothetical protein
MLEFTGLCAGCDRGTTRDDVGLWAVWGLGPMRRKVYGLIDITSPEVEVSFVRDRAFSGKKNCEIWQLHWTDLSISQARV